MGVPLNGAEAQHVMVVSLGAPAAASGTDAAASQGVATGASFVLNGTRAAAGVVTFDVARNVVAAWTTTSILTITGKDEYGQTMSEVTASGTSHTGKKAFKTITSITSSATITAATVGSGTILGLPYRPVLGGFVGGLLNENTADAGTYTVPERTASTTSTNDTRGTYTPAGALNGTNVYTVKIAVRGGPDAFYAYGIAQA